MNVLIADDDAISRRAVRRTLERDGYKVIEAEDGEAAWEILNSPNHPSLAILDWMMPGMDGTRICQQLRERELGSYVYTILLTSRGERRDVVAGFRMGADDYLTKPVDAIELTVRLRAGCRIVKLERELLDAKQKIEHKARYDGLTALLNREQIIFALNTEIERSGRQGDWISVAMGDLDHFKDVNDTHGHQAGDEVLRVTAERLRRQVRAYDSVGRYGGEEFLIVLAGCDPARAGRIAERLLRDINSTPVTTEAAEVPITISLGIAAAHGSMELMPNALIGAADRALYRAKAAGRNRFELCEFAENAEAA